jgi:competence protein ComEC
LQVRLKRRNGFANPGGFDYEGYLFREGIGATGYVREDERNRRLQPAAHGHAALRVRAWIASRISAAVGDERMLGVLQGLAIGDTQAMQPEQWQVFAATGTTHLMAISGLHIGMIAMAAAWCGGFIVRWRRAQSLGLTAMHGQVVAGMSAALIYSILAGLSIPTQRTLIMLCIYFALRWRRRVLAFGQSLSLALIAVLIADPFAPLAVGAWLSFVAVTVILMAVSGRLGRDGMIANFTRVQLAVTVGLVPLLLASFGKLSLVSPLANALAVPLFTLLVVPGVLLGALAAAIHPSFGALVLSAPVAVLNASWQIFEWLARQTLAVWHAPQPSLPVFIALSMGAILLILPAVWPLRLTGMLLCLPMLSYRPPTPAAGTFELTVLDVGQGLATVVRTQSHVLVYDTGPAFPSGRSAAELAVLPFLQHRGVRAIDALVVSHGDQDHSGGLRPLLAALPIRMLAVGPSVGDAPGKVACRRGQQWQWDGVTFSMLHPGPGDLPESGNDTSCVLLIRAREGSALLSGDIEAAAERQLLSRGLPRVAVVVAPHHGSGTSSTSLFVDTLRPDVTIFSTGYRNRWNFPRADVVERWRTAGARTYNTSESGAIAVSFATRDVLVREHRHTQRRYWRRQ